MFFEDSVEFLFDVGDRLAVTPVGCFLITCLVFSPLLLTGLETNHDGGWLLCVYACMRV